jgi:hypothetical protein
VLAACGASALAVLAPSSVAESPAGISTAEHRSVLVAFLRAPAQHRHRAVEDPLERELTAVPGLSIGLMSATQGGYTTAQFLLDLTQGARVASSAYSQTRPPALSLKTVGAGAVIDGWRRARRRAEDAPQLLQPGLLGAQIPGGGAYVAVAGTNTIDGVLAADRAGRVAAVSLGTAPTLLARLAAVTNRKRFVVTDLPGNAAGYADLQTLSESRPAGELLIVLQRAPDTPGHELLWSAVGGLPGGGGKTLTSQTTNERGLIAAVDLAPTILRHLGVTPIPADMRGDAIRTDGPLHSASLRALLARLRVIGGRRLKALAVLLSAWALLGLLSAGRPQTRAWAMRTGALGVMWAPVAVLIPAALEPSPALEYSTIALACLLLGALTDRLITWPRAPIVPAIVAIAALAVDALAGTQLLMRSVLGPDPILGARFYGIGNELKSGLAVLVFAAVAAALYPTVRRSRAATVMSGAGILLAIIEGSARIGAGVGGVILVSAGTAVAAVMLLEGDLTRRRALIVLISPVVGLVALAALDLTTAHGSGHFTGSILHARSVGDLRDVIIRRYSAAWDELHNHAMPVATAFALLYAARGVHRRRRLLSPVAGDPVWLAALAGGLTAGVVGALAEDSGPVLLVVAVFTLGCVLSYLWGRPAHAEQAAPPGRPGP